MVSRRVSRVSRVSSNRSFLLTLLTLREMRLLSDLEPMRVAAGGVPFAAYDVSGPLPGG